MPSCIRLQFCYYLKTFEIDVDALIGNKRRNVKGQNGCYSKIELMMEQNGRYWQMGQFFNFGTNSNLRPRSKP